MKMYQSIDYARGRLVGTIARVKGKAASITGLDSKTVAYVSILEEIERSNPIKDLDITPVPLGYANWGNNAFYVCRSPVRKDWKQGLRPATMRCIGVDGDEGLYVDKEGLKAVAKAIENIYPSIDECLQHLANNRYGHKAFCREFSVKAREGINVLLYKGRYEIGSMDNKKRIKLDPAYNWLNETLEVFNEELYV